MKREQKTGKNMRNQICMITSGMLILFECIDIIRFAILGDKTAFITFGLIAAVFILISYVAGKSRMPFLYLVIAAADFVLYFNTNFSTSTYYFNWMFLVESIVAAERMQRHLRILFRLGILQNYPFTICMWQAAASTLPSQDRCRITRHFWI